MREINEFMIVLFVLLAWFLFVVCLIGHRRARAEGLGSLPLCSRTQYMPCTMVADTPDGKIQNLKHNRKLLCVYPAVLYDIFREETVKRVPISCTVVQQKGSMVHMDCTAGLNEVKTDRDIVLPHKLNLAKRWFFKEDCYDSVN